jgi:hypothetical protein
MATVPGDPGNVINLVPTGSTPDLVDLLMAASVHTKGGQGMFQKPTGGYSEPGAKRWQGFQSRFPKEYIDPEKAKGTPIDPEVLDPSVPNYRGKQSYGWGVT